MHDRTEYTRFTLARTPAPAVSSTPPPPPPLWCTLTWGPYRTRQLSSSHYLYAATRSAFIMSTNCSKQMSASCGPGEASGWYWMVMAFFSLYTMPAATKGGTKY